MAKKKAEALSKGETLAIGAADGPRNVTVASVTESDGRVVVKFVGGEEWNVPAGTDVGVDAPPPVKPGSGGGGGNKP